jgi:hypothetical protein
MYMNNQNPSSGSDTLDAGNQKISKPKNRLPSVVTKLLMLLLVFLLGSGSGYLVANRIIHTDHSMISEGDQVVGQDLINQVNPPDGYKTSVVYGDIGPELLAAGAIDLQTFQNLYAQQNNPLTSSQMDVLTKESASQVIITRLNAYFLLNLFWALGLTNQNTILTQGLMVSGGMAKVGGFASTGGWTIGAKKAMDLYSSRKILSLTDEQQARLFEVASEVYRPCCNNPTHFPDCNHGMAMLGLLELMASQNASTDRMFEAAKYVTAFWYPQQMVEVAIAFSVTQQVSFAQADARWVVSRQYASASGFKSVHTWLSQNNLLEQAPASRNNCGV